MLRPKVETLTSGDEARAASEDGAVTGIFAPQGARSAIRDPLRARASFTPPKSCLLYTSPSPRD
eukprot:13682362-Alexandrium_andersonii.AAC.1